MNDGTYPETVVFNKSGFRGAPITFQATHRREAKIVGRGANTLTLNANWLVVNGFEVTGDKYCIASSVTKHTIVENNLVHNCGASGIQLNGGDYVTIQGNTVYKCAFTSADDGSGISIYEAAATQQPASIRSSSKISVTRMTTMLDRYQMVTASSWTTFCIHRATRFPRRRRPW